MDRIYRVTIGGESVEVSESLLCGRVSEILSGKHFTELSGDGFETCRVKLLQRQEAVVSVAREGCDFCRVAGPAGTLGECPNGCHKRIQTPAGG